jgi:hypothetical protein
MIVDEMVGYQFASKSHVIITKMFFIKIGYMFVCFIAHEHPKPQSPSPRTAQVFA